VNKWIFVECFSCAILREQHANALQETELGAAMRDIVWRQPAGRIYLYYALIITKFAATKITGAHSYPKRDTHNHKRGYDIYFSHMSV